MLRLLESATVRQVADAVTYALAIGTNDTDAVRLILEPRLSLDGHPHLAAVQVQPPDLDAYRDLLVGGVA